LSDHTFLFCDLVGFTALTDAEGDDRAAEVALALYQQVRGLAPDHRAEELKTLGDGVLLRSDQASDGIELALRMVDELESMPAFPPVRVGVHTGPAVERQGEWYGHTVNVASRLCSAASGGEVLVSEQSRRTAGRLRRVEFGERRLHWLRNVTEPIAAYAASSRTPPLLPLRELRPARLLGAGRLAGCPLTRISIAEEAPS
jgi:adenylate cyclase